MKRYFTALVPFVLIAVTACHSGGSQVPGDMQDHEPWQGIKAEEVVRVTGTEPFWGGEVSGSTFTYSTPEDQAGAKLAVDRFAGRGGVSFSGEMGGKPFTLAITPGDCSDGMSDRRYPFVATLKLQDEARQGCAWTDAKPFTGPKAP